jgi:CubicO group peptidase (beta-lactamase class C family)
MGDMVGQLGLTRRALCCLAATGVACRATQPDYDSLIRPLVATGSFMGVVLVSRGERILFERAYGSADLEWSTPNTIDGKFRIGSISKQFTAASVLLLAQGKKLELDRSITSYVPDAPQAWRPITLHHLLTHTSGIPDFLGFADFQSRKALPSPLAETLLRFRDRPLEFTPGTAGRYSNSGYVLLAHIVEHVSGESFDTFLHKRVLEPAGLNDTGVDTHRAILSRRTRGYTRFRSGLGNADYIDMSISTGGGSLYSTVRDLHRWTLALHQDRVVAAGLYRRMTTPTFHNYGYGLEIRSQPGGRIMGHGGGMEGFSGFLQYREKDAIVSAVLSNVNTDVTGRLANQLADLARGGA